MRLFSLIGCVIFSIQIFTFLLKLNLKKIEAGIFSFLILALPSFSVFVFWSATFEVPIALILSFFSGYLLLKSFELNHINKAHYAIALILVIISLFLYQSATTVFLLPFVFSFAIKENHSLLKFKRIIFFIAFAFGLYFILFKLSLLWFQLEPLNRAHIDILKLPVKTILFYAREMRMLLYGSGILLAPVLAFIIGAISFLGFLFFKYKRRDEINKPILLIFFLLAVLPLSYSPNLISVDNFICSRTIAPAAIIILFYQFYFFRELSIKLKALKIISILIAFLFVALGFININTYQVETQNTEYKALKTVFERIDLTVTKKIIFIIPEHDYLQKLETYKLGYADEFGEISSSRPWAPEPMLKQILIEKANLDHSDKNLILNLEVEVYKENDMFTRTSDSEVINIIDIITAEYAK